LGMGDSGTTGGTNSGGIHRREWRETWSLEHETSGKFAGFGGWGGLELPCVNSGFGANFTGAGGHADFGIFRFHAGLEVSAANGRACLSARAIRTGRKGAAGDHEGAGNPGGPSIRDRHENPVRLFRGNSLLDSDGGPKNSWIFGGGRGPVRNHSNFRACCDHGGGGRGGSFPAVPRCTGGRTNKNRIPQPGGGAMCSHIAKNDPPYKGAGAGAGAGGAFGHPNQGGGWGQCWVSCSAHPGFSGGRLGRDRRVWAVPNLGARPL